MSRRSSWIGCLLMCALWIVPEQPAWSQGNSVWALRQKCQRYQRRSDHLSASRCYARLARKTKAARDYLSAAKSHAVAADNQRSPYHEMVLRRRSIYFYYLYLKKAKSPAQKAQAKRARRRQQRALWRAQKAGYAVVWIEGRPKKARYVLYKRGRVVGSGPLPMREELRPGEYVMVIRRKGHHPQRIRLRVRKNETLYHRQRLRRKSEPKPDVVQRSSRPAAPDSGVGPSGSSGRPVPTVVPWIVLGGAVVCGVVGSILISVAAANHAAIQAAPTANQATALFNQNGGLLPAAAIFTVLSAAGGITAGVLFYFAYAS